MVIQIANEIIGSKKREIDMENVTRQSIYGIP